MMKIKAFALILCIILCFSMLMVGCQKECTEHVDENKDAKCDVCEADVACKEHVDEVRDLKCDVCGEELECTEHVNADEDRFCDLCGEQAVPECQKHTDEDKNLVCDVCRMDICDPHKDTDANGLCDVCKAAIVVIYQPTAPEKQDRVDMVVNPIPDDADPLDYIITEDADEAATKFEKLEGAI